MSGHEIEGTVPSSWYLEAKVEVATLRAQNKRLQEAYGLRCVLTNEREDALMAEAATLREALTAALRQAAR
jgi:hypothetical protein